MQLCHAGKCTAWWAHLAECNQFGLIYSQGLHLTIKHSADCWLRNNKTNRSKLVAQFDYRLGKVFPPICIIKPKSNISFRLERSLLIDFVSTAEERAEASKKKIELGQSWFDHIHYCRCGDRVPLPAATHKCHCPHGKVVQCDQCASRLVVAMQITTRDTFHLFSTPTCNATRSSFFCKE